MKNTGLLLLFPLLLSGWLSAQEEVSFEQGCNFHSDKTAGTYTLFRLGPDDDANDIVREILAKAEVPSQNFIIAPTAGIDNAQASIDKRGQRYILYSHNFIEGFKKEAKTKYAAYCVFAHEIGHHVLLHNFSEKDTKRRKKMELQADSFAAVVLARLDVPREDVMAGMETLKANIQAEHYPAPSARAEMLGINYDRERKRMAQKSGGKMGENRISIQIDPLSNNPWNLAQKISGEINEEKVMVTFTLPPQYDGTLVDIVLCSPNPDFRIRTTTGIGMSVKGKAGLNTVTWNYQMDNVPRIIASKPAQLRLYVYSVIHMPTAKLSRGTNIGVAALGIGGAALYGVGHFVMRKQALEDYDTYQLKIEQNDPFYTEQGTTRDGFFRRADKKYIQAQWVESAGIAAVVAGAIWWGISKSKANKQVKNAFCIQGADWRLSPTIRIADRSPGMGLQLRF
ncbi:MAG TPA: hypothetical protein PKD78_12695 [Saprospiraceae bacterium]|nr:hypothetical protein [Saprospiraceae bacterium]